jgi:hypothetical protein
MLLHSQNLMHIQQTIQKIMLVSELRVLMRNRKIIELFFFLVLDTIKIAQEKDDGLKYDELISSFNEIKNELNIQKKIDCKIFSNIFESINWLTNGMEPLLSDQNNNNNDNQKINVLITGSLYLVGLSLKVLEQKID